MVILALTLCAGHMKNVFLAEADRIVIEGVADGAAEARLSCEGRLHLRELCIVLEPLLKL